jgi:hypothetical protein
LVAGEKNFRAAGEAIEFGRTKGRWEKVIAAYTPRTAPRRLGYVVLGAAGDYWGLGAITAQQAAETVFPHSQVRSTPGFTQTVYDYIEQAAQSGTFVGFNPGDCSGVSAGGNIKIIQQGSGLALSGVSMGLTASGAVAAATLAPFTLGISAIIGLLPLFFSHHAAAVAKERRVLCAAVPSATNYLQQIEAAVAQRLATPQQGISALQSLLADFSSQVSSIEKNSSSACNAACVWVKQLTAIVAYQSSQFQDMIAAQTAAAPSSAGGSGPTAAAPITSGSTLQIPTTSAPPAPSASALLTSVVGTTSSPNWLGIAALALLGFFVVKAV